MSYLYKNLKGKKNRSLDDLKGFSKMSNERSRLENRKTDKKKGRNTSINHRFY